MEKFWRSSARGPRVELRLGCGSPMRGMGARWRAPALHPRYSLQRRGGRRANPTAVFAAASCCWWYVGSAGMRNSPARFKTHRAAELCNPNFLCTAQPSTKPSKLRARAQFPTRNISGIQTAYLGLVGCTRSPRGQLPQSAIQQGHRVYRDGPWSAGSRGGGCVEAQLERTMGRSRRGGSKEAWKEGSTAGGVDETPNPECASDGSACRARELFEPAKTAKVRAQMGLRTRGRPDTWPERLVEGDTKREGAKFCVLVVAQNRSPTALFSPHLLVWNVRLVVFESNKKPGADKPQT